MDSFLAFPNKITTTWGPLSDPAIDTFITPILPLSPLGPYSPLSPFGPITPKVIVTDLPKVATTVSVVPTMYSELYPTIFPTSFPTSAWYYDSGIGENPLAQYQTNTDLRYHFLDSWLHEDYPEILRMLKVENGRVRILSETEASNNDISKDTESDYEKKVDFISNEILTLSKNKKILNELVRKNNLKWYDLPYNHHFVKKAQARYVKKKLSEMREGK